MTNLFTTLCTAQALNNGWERVLENRGAPGFDGVSVETFQADLQANIAALATELETESYEPLPYRRVFIDKEDGARRPVVIPAVRDRVAQEALLLLMIPLFEPHLPDCSFAYRPGRSTSRALTRVHEAIAQGKRWVLKGDIEEFFDRVDRALLLQFLGKRIEEQHVLDLIMAFLKAPVMEGMRVEIFRAGVPQGMPLSPLLANIYLEPFDNAVVSAGYQLIRFADDFVIMASTKEECQKSADCVRDALASLKLTLNPEKTAIHDIKDGFVFLGYLIDLKGRGPSKKALDAIEARLETVSRQTELTPLADRLETLDRIIRGWLAYFESLTGIRSPSLPVLLSLARVSLEQGKVQHVRKLLRQAEEQFPEAVSDQDARAELIRLKQQVGQEGSDISPPNSSQSTQIAESGKSDPYASISRLRQLLKNQPDYADGYRELGQCYIAIGHYGLAKKAYERALELEPEAADAEQERFRIVEALGAQAGDLSLSDAQMDRFLALFSGREGVYARQWVDYEGRRGFAPIAGNFDSESLRKHLIGSETFGVYQISKDSTVRFLVIDVDVDKKILLEAARDQSRLGELDRITQKDANRIAVACSKLDILVYVEDSGHKGRHCWIFFAEPVPARLVREFARAILEHAGPASGGIHWEVFPNQDRVREDRLGCLIKLPLGIHRKTGRRCLFVDPEGHAYESQGDFLLSLRATSRDLVDRIGGLVRRSGREAAAEDLQPPTGRVAALLKGCNIVRYLVSKAKDTNYLSHRERLTLLYTLGHLGDEGKAYLTCVIGKTINYNYSITEKYIRRMKDYPISCPKIREVHEELLGVVECKCEFRLPPRGYPSPVLHAFQADAVRVEKSPSAKKKRVVQEVVTRAGSLAQDVSDSPAVATGAATEALAAHDNDARKTEAVRTSKPSALTHEEPACGVPRGSTDASSSLSDEVNRVLAKYLELKKRRLALGTEIQEQEERLAALFEQAGIDSMNTDFGRLRRQREGDRTRWFVEL